MSEEDDNESESSQLMHVKITADNLSGLQNFTVARYKPHLFGLIIKSQSIVEEIMWEELKKLN